MKGLMTVCSVSWEFLSILFMLDSHGLHQGFTHKQRGIDLQNNYTIVTYSG